ncbi:MAG: aminotransferase class I/II-fold pyridoxal phosphate-dependent enzyme, partial [Spirochaetales bacterium]
QTGRVYGQGSGPCLFHRLSLQSRRDFSCQRHVQADCPGALAAVLKSLEIIESEPEHVRRLLGIAARMIAGFKALGFDVGTAETAIVPIVTGNFEKPLRFWKLLFEAGVYANPVLPPAVPPDRCLIRTSYMPILSEADLNQVLEIIGTTVRRPSALYEVSPRGVSRTRYRSWKA